MYVGFSVLSLAISDAFGFLNRKTFLNGYFLRKELLNLGSILFDLVPPIYCLQERQKYKQISVCALISVVCPIGSDEERSSKACVRVSVCVCVCGCVCVKV